MTDRPNLQAATFPALPQIDPALETLREKLYAGLPMLDPRDAEVVTLRFGLDGQGLRLVDEVAEYLQLSRDELLAIEARAVAEIAPEGAG